MVQLSRPFQAVLVALALFVLVWFVALHRPGSGSTSSSVPSSASASARHATAHKPGKAGVATAVHGGTSASSGHVKASTGAVGHAKASTGHATHAGTSGAHGVMRSGSSAHRTDHSSTAGHAHSQAAAATHTAASGASHKASTDPRRTQPARHASAPTAKSTHAPAMQVAVASELKQGKVVLLLFWNPHSSNDSAVHSQVEDVAHKLGRRIAVHTAPANQVGSFGSITRDIQVYQTPTLLIVSPKAQVTTVTGYTEAYALEQTIREARG